MTLTLGDKTYKQPMQDLFTLSIGESRVIERETGLVIREWITALSTHGIDSPKVLASAVYILKARAGERVFWAEIDSLSLMTVASDLKLVEEPDEPEVPAPEVVTVAIPELVEVPAPEVTEPTLVTP
jgi:hypothetical protein